MPRLGVLDPLRAFLSGKRSAPRVPIDVPVYLGGHHGPLEGGTVDLSLGGAMVYLPIGDLRQVTDSEDIFVCVQEHLGGSFDLRFDRAQVVLEAEVVRLVMRPDDPDHIYLGVRFVHDPTPAQISALGLGEIDGADPSLPLEALPLIPREGAPTWAVIHGGTLGTQHAPFQGDVIAMGERALGLRLEQTSTAAVSRWLGRGALDVILLRDGRTLWQTKGDLLAARYLDRRVGTVEVGVLVAEHPPRRVRRGFRRR